MNKSLRLSLLILLCSASVAFAQNAKLYLQIEPFGDPAKPLIVEIGKTVHFTAHAYELTASGARQEVKIDQIEWSVDPLSFGKISPTGDFVVNDVTLPGMIPQGNIRARATVGSVKLDASVFATMKKDPIEPKLEYSISGEVKDAVGNPIAGAMINVLSMNSSSGAGYGATSGSDGKYTVKIPVGSFVVKASANGFVGEYYDNVSTFDKATKLTTDPNSKAIVNINFVLGTGGKISGKVTSAADGLPLKGAYVSIAYTSASGTPQGDSRGASAITDANGEYILSGLAAGKYFVQATAQGYSIQFYNKVFDLKSATQVDVTDGNTTSGIDFALEKGNIDPTNPYTISGTVKDAAGNGLVGGMVTAENPISQQPGSIAKFYAKVEADGKYTLRVPGGTFIIQASAPGFSQEYFDNAKTLDLATKITVNASDKAKDNINFVLTEGGKITGRVTKASDGSPLKEAFVSIVGNSSRPDYNNKGVPTNANGEFEIAGLGTGNYMVMARKDGFVDQYYDKVEKIDQATKVSVIEGQTTANINFELNALPGVTGKVTDADNNQPIPKAEVTVLTPTANGAMLRAYTDQNGEYHLGLPPGTYKIKASAAMYSPEWFSEKNDPMLANDVVVPASGEVVNINFTLERWGGIITGVVKDEAGNPIDKATVKIWSAPTTTSPVEKRFYGMAVTGPDGMYEMRGIAPGKYLVLATAKGFMLEYYNNVADIKLATAVDVVNKQTTSGIDFSLGLGGSISGKVTDAKTSAPIQGAFVSIRSNVNLAELGAKTDANGEYTITGLPTGDYIVFAAAPKYKGQYFKGTPDPKFALPVSVTIPNVTTGIDFALELGPPIKRKFVGTVFDGATRLPIDFTVIEVIDPLTGISSSTTTDAQGRYEIYGETNAILRARAIGYVGSYAGDKKEWYEGKAPVNSGEVIFNLAPMDEVGFAALRGNVVDESNKAPLANAWIFGTDPEGHQFFSYTNARGEFLIDGASTGILDLMVSGVQYEVAHGSSAVNDGTNNTSFSTRKSNETLSADDEKISVKFELAQNYPNPFNPSTTIAYSIPTNGKVTLKVYTLLGHEIATLVDGLKVAGRYTAVWNAENVPSGMYLYKFISNGTTITRKMTLLK